MCRRLPTLTGSRARDAQTHGGFGLVYQHLPGLRSESEPADNMLYQSLPPRPRQLTIDFGVGEVFADVAEWYGL